MTDRLKGRTIAILVDHGFEEVELTRPRDRLRDEGATVHIVSPREGGVRAWARTDWGDEVPVDRPLADTRAGSYDALILPGGVMNPDSLRRNEAALTLVREFFSEQKPVASICHGPWTLIDAGMVKGRRMTSYHSIQTDLRNAGAEWVDEEVVVDRGLVTSRNPDDLDAFCDRVVEVIGEGRHAGQTL